MVTGLNNIPKKGPKFDYYVRVTVASSFFGGDDGYDTTDGYQPNAIVPFSSQGLMFVNETSGAIVEVSFDGINPHCRLDGTPNSGTQVIKYDNRVNSLVWLRLVSGGTATFQVQAWSIH